jgi:hypothetical protein
MIFGDPTVPTSGGRPVYIYIYICIYNIRIQQYSGGRSCGLRGAGVYHSVGARVIYIYIYIYIYMNDIRRHTRVWGREIGVSLGDRVISDAVRGASCSVRPLISLPPLSLLSFLPPLSLLSPSDAKKRGIGDTSLMGTWVMQSR